jgi:hypothetical protein
VDRLCAELFLMPSGMLPRLKNKKTISINNNLLSKLSGSTFSCSILSKNDKNMVD